MSERWRETYDQWKLAAPPGEERPVKEYLLCQVCQRPVETEKDQYACSEECADIVQAYSEKDLL